MARTGRPTKYKREYCTKIIKFFDIEPYDAQEVLVTKRDGTTTSKVEWRAVRFPTLERFAHSIGVNTDTVVEWATAVDEAGDLKHPEFSAVYRRAKELQKSLLIENGLQGLYQSNFAVFVATNLTDMNDKKNIQVGGDLNVALVEFVGESDRHDQDSNT